MTDASYSPTQPLPTPPAPAVQTPAPAPGAPRHTVHYLTGEGVALIVVGALLFGALTFAAGWLGGRMHSRFAARQGFAIGRSYPGMMGGYQQYGQGQGYGYGQGYGRGGMMRQWQDQQGGQGQQNQQLPPNHPAIP